MSTHIEDLKFRISVIDLLRAAKKTYTYRQLANKTGLPVTVLSRYAKGHVLPNSERAQKLSKVLNNLVGLEADLQRKIRFNSDGYFDNTEIIGDFNILKQAASKALEKFAGKRVTKVLTAAVDGIPLATMVSSYLGVDLVIAKRGKEVGVSEFLEETYVLSDSGVTMTLYIPKHALKRRDSILIVDDMVKTGETQVALVNLVKKAKAAICGAIFLLAVGDEWRKKVELPVGCPIEIISQLYLPGR
ncbi:MAG: phosphoribosyltransferase family protein [Candidatus Bathyarchaeia archaeon]